MYAPDTWPVVGRQVSVGAIEPPPGVVPNLVDPSSIEYYSVLCASICLPLVTIFVALRIFTKVFVLHKVCAEDRTCQSKLQIAESRLIRGNRCLSFGVGMSPRGRYLT